MAAAVSDSSSVGADCFFALAGMAMVQRTSFCRLDVGCSSKAGQLHKQDGHFDTEYGETYRDLGLMWKDLKSGLARGSPRRHLLDPSIKEGATSMHLPTVAYY